MLNIRFYSSADIEDDNDELYWKTERANWVKKKVKCPSGGKQFKDNQQFMKHDKHTHAKQIVCEKEFPSLDRVKRVFSFETMEELRNHRQICH